MFVGYVTAYEFGKRPAHRLGLLLAPVDVQVLPAGIGNLLNGLRGRQTEVHVLARYEPAKTMREALHAAAREGVDVAGSALPMSEAMPANVPVDALAGLAADGNGLFA